MPRQYTHHFFKSPLPRFLILAAQTDDCWPWQGRVANNGYATFSVEGKFVSAHRWVYEFCYGPIPPGLDIDHVCHNRDLSCPAGADCLHRRCVNPTHLEAMTHRVNIQRGRTGKVNNRHKNANSMKTECKRGHPFDAANTYYYKGSGYRQCIACRDLWLKAHRVVKNITGDAQSLPT